MRVSVLASVAAVLALSAWSAPRASAHPGSGIVVDDKGRVFFTDTGNPDASFSGHIWTIDARGRLTSAHKTGAHWLALDEKGHYSEQDLKKW
jgi:hypothetical protein